VGGGATELCNVRVDGTYTYHFVLKCHPLMCARYMEDRLPIALPVVTHYKNLRQPCDRAVAFQYRGGVLVDPLDILRLC